MRNTIIHLFTALFLVAATLPAEVVIKRYDGPLPERQITAPPVERSVLPTDLLDKEERPATAFIIPAFKIDSTDPMGETTALGIRNEAGVENTVTVDLFAPDSFTDPITVTKTLMPKEVWTINLRNETGSLPADFGGAIRGWGLIQGEFLPVSVDLFQIDSANDFATGTRPIESAEEGLCTELMLRFLVGGNFTGGTVITFFLNIPQGSDPAESLPSITGTVYGEDGTADGTFEIFTDNFSLEVDAANLIDVENFGSMDISIPNGGGGFALARYKANNRYSVSLKSVCLDPEEL